MSLENQALSRRWFQEVWNEKRDEAVEELLSPEGVGHTEAGDLVGLAPFREMRDQFLAAVPDLRFEVEDVVSDRDDAVVRWRASGTHSGKGFGLEPTDEPIQVRGITWLRFKDGRMVEGWDSWNQDALMQQLREGRDENPEATGATRKGIGDRLREVRVDLYGDRGGSEMARRLGVPVRTWYMAEIGETVPAELLLKFLAETGASPYWVLCGEGPRYASGSGSPSGPGVTSEEVRDLLRTALEKLGGPTRGTQGVK